MAKEVKVRKTKEQKRKEAFERNQISHKRSANDQLRKLNSEKRRALKERAKLAKVLGLSTIAETAGYDFGGDVILWDQCVN